MRCLISGISGYLGSQLARQLLRDGHTVAGIVRPGSSLWRLEDDAEKIIVIQGDMTDLASARRAVLDFEPETVFHFAWFGVTGERHDEAEQITVNVESSLGFFELVAEAGCKTFIGMGSQAEYGNYDIPIREDLAPHPMTSYGVAKLATGILLGKLAELKSMRFVWIRLLQAYGPMDAPGRMVPSLIDDLLRGTDPSLTPGTQVWDYLYIDDVIAAICALMDSPSCQGTYNLGSGEPHTVREMAERIRDLIDPALPLTFGTIPYRHNQPMHLIGDISRLRGATGWVPRVGIEDGLRRTVEWYRRNRLREMDKGET